MKKPLSILLTLAMLMTLVSMANFSVAATSVSLFWPANSRTINSYYGSRPEFGDFHLGIDIAGSIGDPIYAAADGTVVKVGFGVEDSSYGNQVVLYHPALDIYTNYAHASDTKVSLGQSVSAGQVIALIGATGNVTGPHLHFETRNGSGSRYNPLDNSFYYEVAPATDPTNVRTEKSVYSTAESITINWDPVSNASEYWVYMWKDGVELYHTNMELNTAFTSAPTSQGEYTFIVRARNSAGYSSGNSKVSFTVVDKVADTPTNVRTAKKVYSTAESITIYWDPVSNASAYWVYMWKDGVELYHTNMELNTAFTSAPTSEGKYTFIVRAVNSVGYSNGESEVTFIVSNSFTITYDANSGTDAPLPQTKTYGKALTLVSAQPIRDGYVFQGWATDRDAVAPQYLAGGTYDDDADIVLYAVWMASETTAKTDSTETDPSTTDPSAPTVSLLGDANNDNAVNMKDVLALRKFLAGMDVSINITNSDTNEDTFVNMKDVLLIRKFLAGLIDKLGA